MLFNSWQFLLFMIIIFAGYWAIRPQYRYLFLLAGSLVFYASWGPEYLIYLALTVVLTYCSGLLLEILRGGGANTSSYNNCCSGSWRADIF